MISKLRGFCRLFEVAATHPPQEAQNINFWPYVRVMLCYARNVETECLQTRLIILHRFIFFQTFDFQADKYFYS